MSYLNKLQLAHKSRQDKFFPSKQQSHTIKRFKRTRVIDIDYILLRKIFIVVCRHFGYSPALIKRNRSKTGVREYYYYVAYYLYGIPSVKIGKFVKRDHAIVLRGKDKIIERLRLEAATINHLEKIRKELGK